MAIKVTTILDEGELCWWVAESFTQSFQVALPLRPAVLKFVEQTDHVLGNRGADSYGKFYLTNPNIIYQNICLTCSPELVSMVTPGWSSSSFSRSLLLTSCLSLRACLSATAFNIDKYYITFSKEETSSESSPLYLALQCKDALQTINLSNSETKLPCGWWVTHWL